jgi:hypothetical protein
MPDEESSNSAEKKPDGQPPAKTDQVLSKDQQPPAKSDNSSPADDQTETTKFQNQIRNGEWALVIVGALTILVNIVIAYIYYGQLQQMRIATQASTRSAQLAADADEMAEGQFERTMHQTIAQTVTQAEASQTSLQALVAVQRAFMTSTPMNIAVTAQKNPITGGKVRFTQIWENSGVTPAVGLSQAFDHRSLGINEEPTEELFQGGAPSTNGVVGAKVKVGTASVVMNESDVFPPDLKKRTHDDVFWGWVAYYDIFKNTPLHVTEFCEKIGAVTWFEDPKMAPSPDFTLCRSHNCEDNYCPDYEKIKKIAEKASPVTISKP